MLWKTTSPCRVGPRWPEAYMLGAVATSGRAATYASRFGLVLELLWARGAVVLRSTSPSSVVVGHPARKIRERERT